ncbi:hypothetical protein CYK93_14720 [Clostridium perfringens]|nr:hypothetical protein CYK93_14720 [Clostridium perfringens]
MFKRGETKLLDLKNLDDNVYKRSKPKFSDSNFSYKRNENHGYISVHSKKLPFAKEIFINPTAYEILKLCNGKRTPEEISLQIVSLFKGISKEIVDKDLKEVLFQYSKYALINWEEGFNPFMNRYSINLNNDFKLTLADETSLVELKDFLEKDDKLHNIRYLNTTRNIKEYRDELILRQKLFMYSEEFVLLKDKNNRIAGVLSVLIPSNMKSTCSSIGIIDMPKEFVSDSISFIVKIIKEIAVKDLSKIKYQHILDDNENKDFRKIFLENGFISEATLKNEYKDIDIEILSYIL